MSFKEVIDKYKNNTATEEEKKIIENELEKYRELTDYYSELDEFSCPIEEFSQRENKEDLKKIKKAVKKRNIILIASTTCIVFVLLFLFIQGFNYVVKPYLNNKVYFNPESHTYSELTSDLELELITLTKLHFPGIQTQYVNAKNTGIGKYDLTIAQSGISEYGIAYQYGSIDKNEIKINQDFFRYQAINSFAYGTTPFYKPDLWPNNERVIEKIRKLPEATYLEVRLSFDRDMTMEEIVQMKEKNPDLYFCWVGVRNSERDRQRLPLVGFDASDVGIFYDDLNKAYPYYELKGSKEDELISATALTKHFKTLLQFQIDHKKLIDSIVDSNLDSAYYKEVLDYVDKRGVHSYGVVVKGFPNDIIKICEEKSVCWISVNNAKLLVY